MSYEVFYEKKNSKYGEGVMLEKYNGVFSLVAANKSKKAEGTVYKKWGYPQKDKKPLTNEQGEFVIIPWKVELGNSREAIKALKYFLDQLTNYIEKQEDPPF